MTGWFDEGRTERAIDAITAARRRLRVTITKHRFDLTAVCNRCRAKHATTHLDEAAKWAETHECER